MNRTTTIEIGMLALLIPHTLDQDLNYNGSILVGQTTIQQGRKNLLVHVSLNMGWRDWGVLDLLKPNVEKMERKRDIKGLTKALSHQNYLIRTRAAEALGRTGDGRAVKPLIQALNDAHSSVRMAAKTALEQLGDVRTVAPPITITEEVRPAIDAPPATQAYRNLIAVGKPAVEPLTEPLDANKRGSTEWSSVAWAANVPGISGEVRAAPPLVEAQMMPSNEIQPDQPYSTATGPNYFGDGMGPSREAYFRKVHEGHDGLHRYRTRQITHDCNEITKSWWAAHHWIEEARFFRVRTSPLTLVDYEPREFQKLLQGQHANFKRIHSLAYQGPYYTPAWRDHKLTVTIETKPNFGAGYVYKNTWCHQSEQFGECSYSWIDNHPIRVIRQSPER